MLWMSIPIEFVVAAREVLDERVISADHAGRVELRQTPYGSQLRLESSVIGLDRITSVLLNNVTRGRQQLIEYPRVGGRLVGAHLSRVRTVLEGAGEELAGGRQIPLLGHENINDLAVLVDRPVWRHRMRHRRRPCGRHHDLDNDRPRERQAAISQIRSCSNTGIEPSTCSYERKSSLP